MTQRMSLDEALRQACELTQQTSTMAHKMFEPKHIVAANAHQMHDSLAAVLKRLQQDTIYPPVLPPVETVETIEKTLRTTQQEIIAVGESCTIALEHVNDAILSTRGIISLLRFLKSAVPAKRGWI
jgi:hypothetical protein